MYSRLLCTDSSSTSETLRRKETTIADMETNTIWAPADSEDYQVFWQAASEGDVKRLAASLRSDIDVNASYGDGVEGHSVLHEAAFN